MRKGLTFSDISLIPNKSEILPTGTDVSIQLTEKIRLTIPILSAAMDTVTEATMAIALAREGGIGIIHKNMPPDLQLMQVRQVKRSENGMIFDPITIKPNELIQQAVELMKVHKISGVPVVEYGKLKGILTNRDLRFETDLSKPVQTVMTKENLITAFSTINLEAAKELLHKHKVEKLLIINSSNDFKGLITIKDILNLKKYPNSCKDEKGRLCVGAAIGVNTRILHTIQLLEAGVDLLVVDTAHGQSQSVLNAIKGLKQVKGMVPIIAGNIATVNAARDLIEAGADILKVGIGPGSICTTRIVTGFGVPQITALMDVCSVAQDNNIPVVADGGIRYSGEIVKAIAVGASVVMLGNLLAGTEESPGETILYQGRTYKNYRGMGSIAAMEEGSKDRYGQGCIESPAKLVPEGVEGLVPYKGLLSETIYQLIGGLRAGMGYAGCKTINDLRKGVEFVTVTQAGQIESHVHDVVRIKEPLNYRAY